MDIIKTTAVHAGKTTIPKKLRELLGNPKEIMWIDARHDRVDKKFILIRIKV